MSKHYNAYYGSINDGLLSVASGGAATAISTKIIDNGGVVFGVGYSSDFMGAEYGYADSLEKLDFFKGSKYITSKKEVLVEAGRMSVFEAVGQFLRQNRLVLFTGLGCDIYALRHYLEKNGVSTTTLYCLDLICHGATFPYIQEAFVRYLEDKYQSKVAAFSVKNKKRGWLTPSLHAVFENGKEYSKPFYDTDFGYAFDHYSKSGCWNCRFKGDNHLSDITIGDHWGITEKEVGFNKNGVSVLIPHNEKGMNLVNMIQDNFTLYNCTVEEIIKSNPMYQYSRKPDINHDLFYETLKTEGLHKAVNNHRGVMSSLFVPIKRLISSSMSPSVKKKVKNIIGRIHG